jgi:formylglycine-generating enzyme required for sulfatase activity
MKSRWHREDEKAHAPVEMRFIDMFMTALGSLIFLALLLVFLLPKTALQSVTSQDPTDVVPRRQLEDALAENRALQSRIEALLIELRARSEDKHIVKRWFGVLLVTNGCNPFEPELYVRYEGKIVDFESGKPLPDAEPFDASDVRKKTILVGHKYFDVGYGAEETIGAPSVLNLLPFPKSTTREAASSELEDLTKNRLQTKLFYGVNRGGGSWSIYVGLKDAIAQGDIECGINPVYLTSSGLIRGERIVMARWRPFAWLRRVTTNFDGTTTFASQPRGDEDFKRELAEFSRTQSELLCQRKSLCGTMDAHLAILSSASNQARPSSAVHDRPMNPKDIFRDCDLCPEMIVIPSGSFLMGSPDDENSRSLDEGPQYKISIAQPFAVGRFAITFDEWDACAADGGCNGYRPSDEGWGRGRRPVINVSWRDVKEYVEWLSRKTGTRYRLLSEAEREYVTRAGTSTPFWWGPGASTNYANYDGNYTYGNKSKGRYEQKTVPVDSFKPNPWEIYQVHGNVWEWVEDCWHAPSQRTSSDGAAWTTDNCTERIRRGGSWRNNPQFLRAAVRGPSPPDARNNNIGFRVARTL